MAEVRITYLEADKIRTVRGTWNDDNPMWLVLVRTDSTIWMNRRYIIKIEDCVGVQEGI